MSSFHYQARIITVQVLISEGTGEWTESNQVLRGDGRWERNEGEGPEGWFMLMHEAMRDWGSEGGRGSSRYVVYHVFVLFEVNGLERNVQWTAINWMYAFPWHWLESWRCWKITRQQGRAESLRTLACIAFDSNAATVKREQAGQLSTIPPPPCKQALRCTSLQMKGTFGEADNRNVRTRRSYRPEPKCISLHNKSASSGQIALKYLRGTFNCPPLSVSLSPRKSHAN